VRLYLTGQYVYVPEKVHFRWVCAGYWEATNRKPLDFSRNASHRHHLESSEQQRSFPRLGKRFEVLGPATPTYNCICWSLGTTDSWVWPRAGGQPVTLADFDGLYSYYGYKRVVGMDLSVKPGTEKVVLFARRGEYGNAEITHASRQMTDGSWSSKLGSLPLIRHLKPEDVTGPTYGHPWVMYVRVKARSGVETASH
jgi:type VI secretion system secreted protein VgrG